MITLRQLFRTYSLNVAEWGQGRTRLGRLPIVIFFGYLFVRYLQDSNYHSIFGGLNLGVHEFGHLVFGPFGQWLGIAGGTIVQLLAPLSSFVMFYSRTIC